MSAQVHRNWSLTKLAMPLVLALAGSAVASGAAAAAPLNLETTNTVTKYTTVRGNVGGVTPNNRIFQLENFSTNADVVTLGVAGHSTLGPALRVFNTSTGGGTFSSSVRGYGVWGTSAFGIGVLAEGTNTTGTTRGVLGRVFSPDGYGGWFANRTAGPGTAGSALGALGRGHATADLGIGPDGFDGAIEAAGPNGVEGNSTAPGGFGVSGDGPAVGVNGTATATDGIGVSGTGGATGTGVKANGGTTGLSARGTDFGVDSDVTAPGAVGVRSTAGASANDAVQASTSSGIGDALQGTASGSAAFGVFAITSGGGPGVVSSSGPGTAVSAGNSSSNNATVTASNGADPGTAGLFRGKTALDVASPGSAGGTGLRAVLTGNTDGIGTASDDAKDPIVATSDDTNNSAVITATTAAGSNALSHEAIEAFGFVDVNGDARVTGTLTKGGGAFEIDHPLDPANSYLRHSFVESPDMKNIYDGLVTTDGDGKATVTLPDYFGALNRDFRYQLTVIGGGFAQAIVSKEIPEGGRAFEISTDRRNVKVSWQVTGIRKDAFANANRIKVVEKKVGIARGKYLHPEAFAKSASLMLTEKHPLAPSRTAAAVQLAQDDLQALTEKKAKEARKAAAAEQSLPTDARVKRQGTRPARPAPRAISSPEIGG